MTQPTTTTERDRATIERFRADLLNGAVFTRHAVARRSYVGYRPPTSRRDASTLLVGLGRFAADSDQAAQLVSAIVRTLHIYGCREEMLAKAHDTAATAIREGYTDVIGLASPEPPRRRDAQGRYSLGTLLDLLAVLNGGQVGWVEAALRRELCKPEKPYYLAA